MNIEKLDQALKKAGVPDAERTKVKNTVELLYPEKTYTTAIRYLGIIAVILALGAVILLGIKVEVSEALWGALGASIGGLAGIFMGKD